MEKALEILKEIKNQKPFIYRLTSVWCRALVVNEPSKLDEAISELEEAMNPKTCEGCSNLFFDEIEKVYKCSNDVSDDVGYLHGEAVIRNIKDFHCVQHQPKDNA